MKIYKDISQIILWFVLIIGLFIFTLPFIFMISNSFEKFTFSLPFPPRLIPKEFVWDNYKEILDKQRLYKYFLNSTIVTVTTTFFGIMLAALSAYGFARINFKGKEVIFKIYLFTLMVPGVLNIIPQFIILNSINMIATHQGLILLYVGTGICGTTFFLRGFFESVPRELDESVVMDGGSHWIIFRKIMLPLSKPALATISVMMSQGIWDDFFTAKVVLGSKESLFTLPIMVQRLHGQHATKWGLVFAAAILMLIPIIVLYSISQKYFVIGGLSEGGVKG
ncbi:MAG: transporter permease [Clostridia bacterium]|jgi:multiple sugar transport system permease protein|nr:transporter permease [Clostridia bacterium]